MDTIIFGWKKEYIWLYLGKVDKSVPINVIGVDGKKMPLHGMQIYHTELKS